VYGITGDTVYFSPFFGYLQAAISYHRLWFDQDCKRRRVSLHGLLSQAIEQFAARFAGAAIESKGEFIQVDVQMLLPIAH
jgi:hypothetical protein